MEDEPGPSSDTDTHIANCNVCAISRKDFRFQSFEGKKYLLKKGRQTPPIIINTPGKKFTRHFHPHQYLKNKWLTGCPLRNKLFCWPCLLFSSPRQWNIWTNSGYNDLSNLYVAMKKHSLSPVHLQAVLAEKTFGKDMVDNSLEQQREVSDKQYNDIVAKNRDIMKRFVDIVCFLTKQKLPLQGSDEFSVLSNNGNYQELVDLISKYDLTLKYHLQNASLFIDLSNAIQNNLILVVSTVIMQKIKAEINECNFVSIVFDDISDVSDRLQLSCRMHYLTKDTKLQDRFIGFIDIGKSRSVDVLYETVHSILVAYGCEKKLVAQSYDGAVIRSRHLNALQLKVRNAHPQALFVHSMAHRLDFVLSQSAACEVRECKAFFSTLNGLADFFSKSPKAAEELALDIKKMSTEDEILDWNSHSPVVNTVQVHLNSFRFLFEKIIDPDEGWDQDSVTAANGFLVDLQDFTFHFFLNMFANILPESDALFCSLQDKSHNLAYCKAVVNEFSDFLTSMRQDFEVVWEKCHLVADVNKFDRRLRRKRLRLDEGCGEVESHYSGLYCDVLEALKEQVKTRFGKLDSLQFLELIKCNNRENYRMDKKRFPDDQFKSLLNSYSELFDFAALRAQLTAVYHSKELRGKNVSELLLFFRFNDLDEEYEEVVKLCELILTLPMSSQGFSTLQRVKAYARSVRTIHDATPAEVALVSIERDILCDLQKQADFYDKVIDEFAAREGSIQLCYK